MSKTGLKEDLQRDIESYSRGEVPSQVDMPGAALIERWSPEVAHRGDDFVLRLRGEVLRHPGYADGEEVITSPVVWMDRRGRFARTRGRLYFLGDQAGETSGVDGIDG